jgi:hypothetical protein
MEIVIWHLDASFYLTPSIGACLVNHSTFLRHCSTVIGGLGMLPK